MHFEEDRGGGSGGQCVCVCVCACVCVLKEEEEDDDEEERQAHVASKNPDLWESGLCDPNLAWNWVAASRMASLSDVGYVPEITLYTPWPRGEQEAGTGRARGR